MDTSKIRSLAKPIIVTAIRMEIYANNHILKPVGLSTSTFKIMHLIKKLPDLSPVEIMNVLGSTKSNITQRLNNLEKKGLIKRATPALSADKRKITIGLTPQGRIILEKAIWLVNDRSVDLEKHFSRQEIDAHVCFFKKLNLILDKYDKKPGGMPDSCLHNSAD